MKANYLTEPRYIKELVPLHVIAALHDVEADDETKELCQEVARAMLRLRDKLSSRPVRTDKRTTSSPSM